MPVMLSALKMKYCYTDFIVMETKILACPYVIEEQDKVDSSNSSS